MMKPHMPEQNRTDRVVEALERVSRDVGRPPAQVALAWLRTREVPVIPIVGARRLDQLNDNLASLTLTLSPAQVATLDEASAIEPGFPNEFYGREMVRHLVHAGMRERLLA
jgi:aryl-alcohol dehydrogenase-like predicted oxidoreductase